MPTQAQTDLTELDLTKSGDEVDPELLQLPDPPRKERRTTLLLMATAAICSAAMAVGLGRDASYALGSASATDLGDLAATPETAFVANGFVQGAGRLGGSGALRYERPFESDSYRVMPVSGRDDVWVEVRVPAGDESSRYVPQQTFSGRLVPFAQAGLRHRGLRSGIEDATGRRSRRRHGSSSTVRRPPMHAGRWASWPCSRPLRCGTSAPCSGWCGRSSSSLVRSWP